MLTLILNNVDVTCTVAPAIIFYNVCECAIRKEETTTKCVDTKNAEVKTVAEYTPTNAFTYVIVAGDEFMPVGYTFWKGESQLAGSKTQHMQGTMNGEMRPDMPDTEQGTLPEFPEGMERPKRPNDKFSGGERPQMPCGENSTTFTITKGANQFVNVGAQKTEL